MKNTNNERRGNGSNKKIQKQLPPNYVAKIPMYEQGIAGSREYDVDALIDILRTIPFEKISIPLFGAKKLMLGDDKKGTMQIGYINKPIFDKYTSSDGNEYDTVDFDVTIYANNAEATKNIEYPLIYPKVKVSPAGEIEIILGFELMANEPDEDWSSTDTH